MGTGYKNRGSGAAGLGFKNRGAKLVEGAAYTNRGATDGVNEAFKNRGQAWGSDAYYNRGPNDFASLSVLGLAAFYAPLTSSLILTRGTGNPTYTRSTSAWEFDNEGKLILVPSGAARFGGARMVRNIITYTEDLSNAIWSKFNNATVTGSNQVNLTADNDSRIVQNGIAASSPYGNSCLFSVLLSGSGQCYIGVFDDSAPWPSTFSGVITLTATPTRYSLLRTNQTVAATRMGAMISVRSLGTPATVIVEKAQLENVTGQADQTASEYVSAGVLAAPYHGAGVDGVKWFDTNKDGSAISASSLLGYHAEGSRTNSLLYSRDLTNAAWAATNITPAKTATGIDNAANSASTLTASAADATILQTLSLAAASRSFSAYVKRRTGTGSVYITRDGGTNWTDITSSLGASWTRVKIENTSVLNPSVGFKIATSGDAIDVDVCQDEAGAFISSPIITTTASVTRNEDRLLYAKAGNLLDASGTACVDWSIESSSSTYGATSRNVLVVDANGRICYGQSTALVTQSSAYDGTNQCHSINGLSRANGTHRKHATAWSGIVMSVLGEGSTVATSAYDGSMGAGSSIDVGGIASGSPSYGFIRDIYIWHTALTDTQLQQVTA